MRFSHQARRLLKEAGAEGLKFELLNRTVDQPFKYLGAWLVVGTLEWPPYAAGFVLLEPALYRGTLKRRFLRAGK